MKKAKRPAPLRAARPASLCAAALAIVLALCSCAAQPGGAAEVTFVPSASSGPQSALSPSDGPASSLGALPKSDDARVVDALPQDVWLTVNTQSGSVLLRGGERLAKTGAGGVWLLDGAGREEPVRLESAAGQYEASHTLYAIDGGLLLACGELYPYARLGGWVFLNSQLNKPASHAHNLDSGETGFEGYTLQALLPGGYALLDSGGGTTLPPLLLGPNLKTARRFDGYSRAFEYRGCGEELPGYIVLCPPDGGQQLYSLARDEILSGGFIDMVDCGEPAGLFETDEGWQIRSLADDKPLSEPDTGSPKRLYSVYTRQVRLYRLEGGDEICYLEYPGGTVVSPDAGPAPGGWYAQQADGRVLLIGREGELQGILSARPGAAFWGSVGMRPGLRLRVWEDGCELLSRGGVLQLDGVQFASLEQLAAGRYAFSRMENGTQTVSLLAGDGGELLAGLEALYVTALPNVWQVQKSGETGLMNEAGQWLWRESATFLPADARCNLPGTNVSSAG